LTKTLSRGRKIFVIRNQRPFSSHDKDRHTETHVERNTQAHAVTHSTGACACAHTHTHTQNHPELHCRQVYLITHTQWIYSHALTLQEQMHTLSTLTQQTHTQHIYYTDNRGAHTPSRFIHTPRHIPGRCAWAAHPAHLEAPDTQENRLTDTYTCLCPHTPT
jgi:hypothetical protein